MLKQYLYDKYYRNIWDIIDRGSVYLWSRWPNDMIILDVSHKLVNWEELEQQFPVDNLDDLVYKYFKELMYQVPLRDDLGRYHNNFFSLIKGEPREGTIWNKIDKFIFE